MRSTILLVDDELPVRKVIRHGLEIKGFDIVEASDCRSAEQTFLTERPDGAVIDYSLPDGNALELLPRLKAIDADAPVVILTGFGSIDLAVRAIKEGADHFLTKPVEMAVLALILERLVNTRRERRKHLARRSRQDQNHIDPFLGSSAAIRQLAELIRRALAGNSLILLKGETGTGKGVLARWLHENGPRSDEPFVDVNCAGLTREFLETELFGHEKGAYTGAVSVKQGLFEVADRGTIFLDEIGDVDPQVQPKLLKVIEEKRFRRLGGVADRQVDVRLITATHQDIDRLVNEGRFRQDLYYRVSMIVIDVPPLRDRGDDIITLARRFLDRCPASLGHDHVALSPEAEETLRRYSWPGNIRELHNVLERAVLLADKPVLSDKDLCLDNRRPPSSTSAIDTSLTLEEMERLHIEAVLGEERGHIDRAARRLGIHRSSLYNKVKKFNIALLRA